jgi:hypothetical protein
VGVLSCQRNFVALSAAKGLHFFVALSAAKGLHFFVVPSVAFVVPSVARDLLFLYLIAEYRLMT